MLGSQVCKVQLVEQTHDPDIQSIFNLNELIVIIFTVRSE